MNEHRLSGHAAEAEKTKFLKGNISSACLGRLKTYKGFVWKYKNKDIVYS